MAAGVDYISGQRGREIAGSHLNRPVTDREQAVAAFDCLAYLRLACLAAVNAEIIWERLVDYGFGCVDHGHRSLQLLGQPHELGRDAEPVRVRIDEDRW